MRYFYDWFILMTEALNTHIMETVILALVGGSMCISLVMAVMLWKQAQYAKAYERDGSST